MTTDEGDEVPEDVARALEACSNEELRAVTREAQRLLAERIGPMAQIEPRHEGEEIISTEEKETYVLVVVRVDWSDSPQAYHVTSEPGLGGDEEGYYWRYVGPVES